MSRHAEVMQARGDDAAIRALDPDVLWFVEGVASRYRLRRKPAAFWCLRGPRHIRALVHLWRIRRWNAIYKAIGIEPPRYERWIGYAIWRGWQ